ncbi:MAG TPA: hypothetical protein VFR59_07980 [Steroidobacteraceae bacterium]|nr:hypothetical protein [Steroidobacteraceae bacterium]
MTQFAAALPLSLLRIAEPKRAYQTRDDAVPEGCVRELRLVMSVLTVAIAALRRQNADCDADIAEVLERFASDRLDVQIEKLIARHGEN